MKNFFKILPPSSIAVVLGWIGSYFLVQKFTVYSLIKGNYGEFAYYLHIICDAILIFGTGILLGAMVYKMSYFKNPLSAKSGTGFFGSILAFLIGGCASCTITLAGLLGFSTFLAIFPYGGLEIKIIGVTIMLIFLVLELKDLEACRIPKKKKN